MKRRRASRGRGASDGGARAAAGATVEVRIDSLGARGDGIAVHDGLPLYVPLTVPGDRVRARPVERRADGAAAELVDVLAPGPARVAPPCPYYGDCGGCALQHMATAAAAEWKRDRVAEALAKHGLGAVPVERTVALPTAAQDPAGGRRRAMFVADRRDGRVRVGFNARATHRAVDVAHCLVLGAPLNGLIAPLGRLFADILADGGRAQTMATDLAPGLDVLLILPSPPDLAGLERMAAFARDAAIRRLSWRLKAGGPIEPVVAAGPSDVRFGAVAVEFPPGAFLQPSRAGEAALGALVRGGVGDAAAVVDLFAGLGTFAFALAEGGRTVHAVEGDAASVRALTQAAARAALGGRLTAETRDLGKRPLAGNDLARFDAAVFDPPRPGAPAQARALAAAPGLRRVVSVSCNPATFARDARYLIDGGFVPDRVVPVDQFAYSPHLEVVGWFSRPGAAVAGGPKTG